MKKFRITYYCSSTSRWAEHAWIDAVSKAQALLLFYGSNHFTCNVWSVNEVIKQPLL